VLMLLGSVKAVGVNHRASVVHTPRSNDSGSPTSAASPPGASTSVTFCTYAAWVRSRSARLP